MKTFKVKTTDGQTLEGEQLATFAFYVQSQQFRFLVLHMPDGSISLTERKSGKRVAKLEAQATPSEYVQAGERALNALIQKHGEARVRAVLAGG